MDLQTVAYNVNSITMSKATAGTCWYPSNRQYEYCGHGSSDPADTAAPKTHVPQ